MAEKECFERISIALTEKNERVLRGIYQFTPQSISFEVFINNWIENELYTSGFE